MPFRLEPLVDSAFASALGSTLITSPSSESMNVSTDPSDLSLMLIGVIIPPDCLLFVARGVEATDSVLMDWAGVGREPRVDRLGGMLGRFDACKGFGEGG